MQTPCQSHSAFILIQTPAAATVAVDVGRKHFKSQINSDKEQNKTIIASPRLREKLVFSSYCNPPSIALNKPSKCCLRNIANNSEGQMEHEGENSSFAACCDNNSFSSRAWNGDDNFSSAFRRN